MIRNLIRRNNGEGQLPARREEYDPFSILQNEMNRMFNSFTRGFFDLTPFSETGLDKLTSRFSPSVEVEETEKEIKVSAELPGIEEKDVNVSLTDDALTIRGEKKTEKEENRKGFYRSERTFGSFQRVLPLPCEVVADKVEAKFKNGVLSIVLPKAPSAQKEAKKIQIKPE